MRRGHESGRLYLGEGSRETTICLVVRGCIRGRLNLRANVLGLTFNHVSGKVVEKQKNVVGHYVGSQNRSIGMSGLGGL